MLCFPTDKFYVRESAVCDRLCGLPLQPQTQLAWAMEDLREAKGDRNLVNAVGNAKRALHCQVDALVETLGGPRIFNEKRNFPSRIAFCEACGIVGRRLVERFNRMRNLMEHEYEIPAHDEVVDFLDVVELFLAASTPFLKNYPSDFTVEATREGIPGVPLWTAHVELPPASGCLSVSLEHFRVERAAHADARIEEFTAQMHDRAASSPHPLVFIGSMREAGIGRLRMNEREYYWSNSRTVVRVDEEAVYCDNVAYVLRER